MPTTMHKIRMPSHVMPVMRELEQKITALRKGKISDEEFWRWWEEKFGIHGTGPILQELLKEKWEGWENHTNSELL